MDPTAMFGPLDLLYEYVEYVLLLLILVNAVTRFLGHRQTVRQYREHGEDGITQFTPHLVANVLLVLATVYYTTIAFEAGILLTILVITVIVTDVFEFEAQLVQAREDRDIDLPKGAVAAWAVAAIYVSYRALTFVVNPVWDVVAA